MRHLSNLEMRQSPTFTAHALANSKLERKADDFTLPGVRPGVLRSRHAFDHLVAKKSCIVLKPSRRSATGG